MSAPCWQDCIAGDCLEEEYYSFEEDNGFQKGFIVFARRADGPQWPYLASLFRTMDGGWWYDSPFIVSRRLNLLGHNLTQEEAEGAAMMIWRMG